MLCRASSAVLMALALTLGVLSCRSTAATDQGQVVEVGVSALTVTDTAGANQHTHVLASKTVITCDGKPCGLNEVEVGDMVTVTTDTKEGQPFATKIEAKKAVG